MTEKIVGFEESVKTLYSSGHGVPYISKKFGFSEHVAYRILHEAGFSPKEEIKARQRKWLTAFTKEQDKEITHLYTEEKQSLSQIATLYGRCIATVRKALLRENIKLNPRGNRYRDFSPGEINDIISLYKVGWSQTEIGGKFRTHQTIISRVLRQNGIQAENQIATRERHGMWKGGSISISGYKFIHLPLGHPYRPMAGRTGYAAEHRLKMAEYLGRPLLHSETVHHINGEKMDNRIENLQIRQSRHGKGITLVCADCGSINILEKALPA